ncbi:GNAT family N-acetyltransferase [Companilactobacillus futsaii]|uniref:GNAT family N-acetyltransferase n=2 Tax=Companilactobacillus futsaii TaxID=938155 RepID=A0A5B7T2Q4_9LACO|nr:GNAT family N-acetyltransferase [Companilactobacillus futsaii]KRK90576.1 GCN5-related N-acetyltransferase [Companilactobacillus futsaii JCM 17355]QCX24642.1 GNAT family N-acetyltransferase [Companilactobacillus futsaii]
MTKIQIKEFNPTELEKVRQFATTGMQFDKYINNRFALHFYGKIVAEMELKNSTIALGAYLNDKLVGFIFARVNFQRLKYSNLKRNLTVSIGNKLINLFDNDDMTKTYDQANQKMLKQFMKNKPDGEITFFAVDSNIKHQGIGTQLLEALENKLHQQQIYVFTDSNCDYQFYLKKGFKIFDQIDVTLDQNDPTPLTCFLLYKNIL